MKSIHVDDQIPPYMNGLDIAYIDGLVEGFCGCALTAALTPASHEHITALGSMPRKTVA